MTFDNWFTQPAFCRFLDQTLKLPYVGTLAETDKVNVEKGQSTLKDFAEQLKQAHLQSHPSSAKPVFETIIIPYKGEQETYYSYCNTHSLPNFGKQRLVINYRQADLSDEPNLFHQQPLVLARQGHHPHSTPSLAR